MVKIKFLKKVAKLLTSVSMIFLLNLNRNKKVIRIKVAEQANEPEKNPLKNKFTI